MIAVLGWGSLVWNPGTLPLGSGWFEDGPELPVEFARKSKDGRLTLVLHGQKRVPVLWAKLDCKGKSEAIEALRKREGTRERHIGWRFGSSQSTSTEFGEQHRISISQWCFEKGLDGVVWTALPPKFGKDEAKNGIAPTQQEAIDYLHRLEGSHRDLAFEYIREAPQQIRTPYRAAFESVFPELKSEAGSA